MCGIAGIVGFDPRAQIHSADIRVMCNAIVHRGPDDDGVFADGPVGLGMRRLSIIDVSGGHQPIHNEDKTVWIVFNGEIYNFLELRTELEARGHCFSTNSDTEVIVHLYEDFGSQCVAMLRGMFAFALWDRRERKLLLARDRLGKKPLHYATRNGQLLFGSEIRSLLTVAPELSERDDEALLEYFALGYTLDPLTAFRRIKKLPPAHLLECSRGNITIQRYWELPRYGTDVSLSEEECLELLERELTDAVRRRLMSEVPLGALLSGGVDSSLIVALMARSSSSRVKTFSIGFAERSFDERSHASLVAKRFDTEHHELIVTPDLSSILEKLTAHMEEPFADGSMVPTFYVCEMARRHVTVALSGDGGDELFAGYDRYSKHLSRRPFPDWIASWYRNWVYPMLPSMFPGRRYGYNSSLEDCERYLDSMSAFCAWNRDRSFFSKDFLRRGQSGRLAPLEFRRIYDSAPVPDAVSRLQYLDTLTYLHADVLTKVDRMSMANSLEVRCPLLDHVVVEAAAKLPSKWKLHIGESKYLLKKLAERVGVPAEVLYRKKQGFAVPLVKWFRREMKDELMDLLLDRRTLQRGYFNERGVRALLVEHFTGRRDRSLEVWTLLVFELWHRNFLEALPHSHTNVAPQYA